MNPICNDLEKQYQEFDDLVSTLDAESWRSKTPFYDWTIFDQVAHIAFFDHEALFAIQDSLLFKERSKAVMDVIMSDKGLRKFTNRLLGIKDPKKLLDFWRDIRSRLILRLCRMSSKERLPWYGPDMSVLSFITARLMETWAHSQDVFDALRKKRIDGERLFHIAHMGVSTLAWSFIIKKLPPPKINPRVELIGPSGEFWEWGEPDSGEKVWGRADEFCLVVTQRRNLLDTGLKWQGKDTGKWLSIAQAFAGVSQEPPAQGFRNIDYGKGCKPNIRGCS